MHCRFCGFANGEDDHRCLRCGRRIAGIVIAAPAGYGGGSAGANALAVAPAFEANETRDLSPANAPDPVQPPLFPSPGQKVIPFDQLQRHVTGRMPAAPSGHPGTTVKFPAPPRAPHTRKPAGAIAEQGSLDFLPAAQSAPRTLKTDVPAQIYCEQPVATPTHRLIASAMDAAMIFLGFGAFVVASELLGGNFGGGKIFWIAMASSFALISLFYGLIWAIAGRETAGMSWTDLHLITFDGFPVEGGNRTVRMASAWLSFCSGGLGLLWALADEEHLPWHDHISKTFPTIREVPKSFVRQRKR